MREETGTHQLAHPTRPTPIRCVHTKRKEQKKERRKEGKKERKKEGKKERRKERKKERKKPTNQVAN